MTKLRIPQVSENQLKVVREASPVLADLTGRRQGAGEDKASASADFGPAHPIHVLGLRDLVAGGRISEAPVAIRVLESRGPDISAFYDLTPSESAPELMQMAATDDENASRIKQGMAVATSWAEKRQGQTDLRLLRIPALYTEALLLRTQGDKEDTAIVIRTPHREVDVLKPMPLSELVRKLEAPARLILDHDDGVKGS